jgi:hypothetical protein
LSGSDEHYATNLLLSAFDEQKLAGSNATGFTTKKGVKKAKLDSKRMAWIQAQAFDKYRTPDAQKVKIWRKCLNAINTRCGKITNKLTQNVI